MIKEPSLLLIDDWQNHYDHVLMMNLNQEGWVVEGAIDPSIDGAFDKARRKIQKYDGFSVILLDIMWELGGELYGGIKILHRLSKVLGNRPISRQVVPVTRKSSTIEEDPNIKELVRKLRIPIDMQRMFLFETQHGRDSLKKYLLDLWQQIQPKS